MAHGPHFEKFDFAKFVSDSYHSKCILTRSNGVAFASTGLVNNLAKSESGTDWVSCCDSFHIPATSLQSRIPNSIAPAASGLVMLYERMMSPALAAGPDATVGCAPARCPAGGTVGGTCTGAPGAAMFVGCTGAAAACPYRNDSGDGIPCCTDGPW